MKEHKRLYDFKSVGNSKPSLEQQLAAAKAEIAEYREALEELASCFEHLANDEGSCTANGYFDYNQAVELLAKHKGE